MSDCSCTCLSDCKERSCTCLSDCKEHSCTCMSDLKNVAAHACRIVKNLVLRVYRIVKPVAPPLHRVKSVSSKPNCSVLLFAVITDGREPRSGDWISWQALNFDCLKPNTSRNICVKENQIATHTRLQTHMCHSCSHMFYSLGIYFSWLLFFLFPKWVRACRLPFRHKYNSDIIFPFFGRL